jgi:ribosome biogenesis GTPase A
MIVGIPNVGKSTFINAFAGKACTKTGNKPGVTKGKQWIHINKNLELLDTPGILWPKFDDKLVGMRLAMIGSMNDQVINLEDLSFEILKFIKENYPGFIKARYEVDENREILEIMDEIGRVRGCLKKGSMIDYEKLAGVIADDFRSGRLGRITLERP